MTTNYATALEEEAYQLARRKLIRAADQTGNTEDLPGWLANLNRIHQRRMEQARQWVQPRIHNLPPLTPANVSNEAVQQVAINSVAEAQEPQS